VKELWCAIALFAVLAVLAFVSPVRAKERRPFGATLEPIRVIEDGKVRIYAVPFGITERCLAVADGPMGGLVVSSCP
jgi:hypothetical protein